MDRYTILLLVNLPFIIFGVVRAIDMFKSSVTNFGGLIARLLFWSAITISLVFAKNIYTDFYDRGWVNGSVISVTTILLTTGIIFNLFLAIRLYSKIDTVEKYQAELLTKVSIITSEQVNKTIE